MVDKGRIAHFVSAFEVGGVQSVAEQLAVAQAREGFVVFVCAIGGAKGDCRCQNVERLQHIQFGLSGRNCLSGLVGIVHFLRQNKIQVLHAHPGTLSRLAGILAGVPVIISTLHGSWPASDFVMRAVRRWLASHTARLVANSNYTKGYYAALFDLREDQCVTIYNGVDTERFCNVDQQGQIELRVRFGLPSDAQVVVSVGRLHPDKGVNVLISAAAMIVSKMPNVHFLVVGHGECRYELERQAKTEAIDSHVHFAGPLADVRPALAGADVFVLPSARREGFGLALVEAMAMGLPVVGTNLGGIPEIITDGVDGLLSRPGDVGSLASAIGDLLSRPESARQLVANGKRTACERFSLARMVEEYRRLYCSLMEDAKVPC